MREYDYFDYDGDIPSTYSPLAYTESNNSGDSAEAFNSANSDGELAPPAPSVSLPPVKTDYNEPKPESDEIVLSEEVTAAIEAFEHMNLPKEELRKEIEKRHAEHAAEEKAAEIRREKEKKEKKEKKEEKPEPEEPVSEKFKTLAKKGINKAKDIKEKQEEKEVSKVKHFFIILLLFVLVIVIFTGVVTIFMSSITKENKRAGEFNKNAADICSSYSMKYGNANYENLYDLYKVEGYRLTGLCFVRELDFNNDGESELMLVYNKTGKYYNEVWGIGDKGEFQLLYSEVTAQSESKAKDAYSLLYHSKNKYYIARFDNKNLNKFSLMQLRGDGFDKKYDGEYDAKTKAYSVDGKDDTDSFERIKYSVLKEEKASVESERVAALIESFSSGGDSTKAPGEIQSLNNAYYQLVQDYNKRYGVSKLVNKNGEAYIDGLAVVELIDFDGDGQKELLLVYRKPVKVRSETARGENVTYEVDRYYCDIYRYSGSRAILSYSNEGLSNKLNYRSDIYYMIRREKKKAYYCLNSFTNSDYGNHITAVSAEYEFNGTEFKTTFKSSYATDYGYSHYFLEGKSVDKYEFNEKGYKNPFFDSEEKYDKEKYRVVYVQRSSADSGELKDIPKQTEEAIQSLNQLYSADIKE